MAGDTITGAALAFVMISAYVLGFAEIFFGF